MHVNKILFLTLKLFQRNVKREIGVKEVEILSPRQLCLLIPHVIFRHWSPQFYITLLFECSFKSNNKVKKRTSYIWSCFPPVVQVNFWLTLHKLFWDNCPHSLFWAQTHTKPHICGHFKCILACCVLTLCGVYCVCITKGMLTMLRSIVSIPFVVWF